MAELQFHRGPDDGGVMLFDECGAPFAVALASRRLSILDLSPAGHQPMSNEDGSVWTVFNGEIYNFVRLRSELESRGHHFRSRTDTEILVHGYEQWGLGGLLRRINGMFAFAIWDRKSNRISIARDRFGEKPLYYFCDGTSFAFSSELKSLCGSGLFAPRLSPAGAVAYLMLGSVPAPLTIFEGVNALPPGHLLVFDGEQPRIERYWDLSFSESAGISENDAAEQTLDLMREAVHSRLVSDVPVGVFLSGGMDSSAIVALARESIAGPLKSYSIAFKERAFNEGRFAQTVAHKFGTEHIPCLVTAAGLKTELPAVISSMDQPTVDGINTYFVSKLTRSNGTVVALSGLGGDELFGGYGTFRRAPRVLAMARLLGPRSWRTSLGKTALHLRPQGSMDRAAAFMAGPLTVERSYLALRGVFSAETLAKLLEPEFVQAGLRGFDAAAYLSSCLPGNGCVQNAISALELRTYLCNQLLRDTDVMSMAHSLEVRAPFLDHRLVEFVASLPAPLKFAGQPKGLMLRALGSRLPGEVTNRPKQGFTFPFDQWLRNELRATAEDTLLGCDHRDVFNRNALAELWRQFLDRRVHWSRIWALMTLDNWLRSFGRRSSELNQDRPRLVAVDSPTLVDSVEHANASSQQLAITSPSGCPPGNLDRTAALFRSERSEQRERSRRISDSFKCNREAGTGFGARGALRYRTRNIYGAHYLRDGTITAKSGTVLGVFSQLTGHGGIPYAGRQAAAVLASFAREHQMDCLILGLNDSAGERTIVFGDSAFSFIGHEGSKARLAKRVFSAAPRVKLAYFGHCGVAQLGLALKLRSRCQYVVAGHGIEMCRPLSTLERIVCANAAAVTAPSRYTATQIQQHASISADRVAVIPWGLDPAFRARASVNGHRALLPAGPILLTVARLDSRERYKGVESVIEAMPQLLSKVPDLNYIVVGDGDDRPRLESRARALGFAEQVLFAGRRTDEEVGSYYAAADIYVMPSRSEGLGLVFLEAMACGKPVIAASEAATPEVVIDGETGFLVGYNDVEALAERLCTLLCDAELQIRMGAAGRRRLEQNYTFESFRERLASLFSQQVSSAEDIVSAV
jgi:asparagine synthase (glutamine-hydrolysing)